MVCCAIEAHIIDSVKKKKKKKLHYYTKQAVCANTYIFMFSVHDLNRLR